jgi:hypothetical protein
MAAPRLFSKKPQGETALVSPCHPHPVAGPRSPAARQESSSSSCTFPYARSFVLRQPTAMYGPCW